MVLATPSHAAITSFLPSPLVSLQTLYRTGRPRYPHPCAMDLVNWQSLSMNDAVRSMVYEIHAPPKNPSRSLFRIALQLAIRYYTIWIFFVKIASCGFWGTKLRWVDEALTDINLDSGLSTFSRPRKRAGAKRTASIRRPWKWRQALCCQLGS